jgi:hypothetical protein
MKKISLAVALAFALLISTFGSASAITNGVPDGDNHPYVGLAVFDVGGSPSHRCSASLLSPTVVLTAGHCTDGTSAARVWLDTETAVDFVGYGVQEQIRGIHSRSIDNLSKMSMIQAGLMTVHGLYFSRSLSAT